MQVTYLECQVCLLIFFKERLNYWGVKKKTETKTKAELLMLQKFKDITSFPFSSVLLLLVFANTPLSAFASSFSLLESFLLEYWALLLLANLD